MSAARARGVIFADFSVRAILAFSKTQTRRLVNLRSKDGRCSKDCTGTLPERAWADPGLGAGGYLKVPCRDGASQRVRGPFGDIGDRLYVKESTGHPWHHAQPRIFYRATAPELENHPDFGGWGSPMFMRRKDARIELLISGIRVERLQAISDVDARLEGVRLVPRKIGSGALWALDPDGGAELQGRSPAAAYAKAWTALHGAGSWEQNPWVWVITFDRIMKGSP